MADGLKADGVEPRGAAAGWEALARLNADAALRAFAGGQESNAPAAAREERFGRAVALLAKQPVTVENIAEARRIFTDLAGSGGDDIALGARYFLGRIAQHHLETPDLAEAAKQYRQLIDEHRESIWAQTALTRLALLELYADDAAGSLPAARVAMTEKLVAAAVLPAAQSELHLVIADAVFYYGLPEAAALPHLLAAEKLGRLDGPTRADVLIQIAEVSAQTGNRAQAKEYYEAYLAGFPLDQRRFMVKEKLKALP